MKKYLFTLFLVTLAAVTADAQRKTDALDRGLVAVKVSNGVFVSWRQQADEYYDVTYNLYRNGTKVNATPLSVTNYTDTGGNTSSTYTVKAVIDGTEKEACDAVSVWSNGQYSANGVAGAPNYLTIPMKDIVDRNGDIVFCSCGEHNPSVSVRQTYTLNDASVADLDGDGEVEVIIKRLNASDASTNDAVTIDEGTYPLSFNGEMYSATNTRAYVILEAYKLDGTRLWWIDCGPNMVSLNSTELNIVAYDWDQDGKAEVLLRGADNMIIHKSDNTTYEVGNMNVNTRNHMTSHSDSQYAWTLTGNEYLLYLEGATANPYSVTEFPLKRLETSEYSDEIDWENPETDKLNAYINAVGTAWGDNYGHRSSKYFFGAPFLDGKKASIFLARGIYTRHKMIAIDVDPATHAFTTKWTWACSDATSPFHGQGNHNFSIADVDGDGCDEIIYGSMTIDNNGKGLSSTGLGHGDALHVSDLDPFTKGMEVFACNEDRPANNLRDATTSYIYHRDIASSDDGRALMGNFSNDYPGCLGRSVTSGVISSVTHETVDAFSSADDFITWNWLNGRIYWDGDLCEEYLNSPGKERECVVAKPGGNRIMQTSGVKLNNDSKNNPCFQGDILGDWREELILRNTENTELRIYTTTTPTDYAIPSLWYDPEYRQSMVWQMCAYNQPPHVSFFMGEMEGLTKVPVPLTNTNRTLINNGGSITSANNGNDILVTDAGNIGITSDVSPRNIIMNVPSSVNGNDDNANITYSYSTTTLGTANGGDITGATIVTKQGGGLLNMPDRTLSYTGNTEVFEGSLAFNGTLSNSEVWMNRHTNLYTAGTFTQPVTMEYGSKLYICKDNATGDGSLPEAEYTSANFKTLNLHEGARVAFNVNKSLKKYDVLNVENLNLRTQDWKYGPKYHSPVFEVNNASSKITVGTYPLCKADNINGDINDIDIESATGFANNTIRTLENVDGVIYLNVSYENELYIGSKYNISSIWTEFSPSYTIAKGETYNFKFVNYGGKKQSQNWILAAVNGDGHSTADRADYAEYFSLVADGTVLAPGHTTEADNITISKDWTDMEKFIADMEEADVDVTVSYGNDNVLNVSAVMTAADGDTYNYTAQYTGCTADDMTLFFTVDHSHMTYPEATHTEKGPDVKMTYVDYNNADTSYGEVTTAQTGYNKISSANTVGFANTGWNCNWITYLQVDLSEYKNVNNVTLKFKGSGSTDSNRTTQWGVGYNSSTWSSDMTYNTADKNITMLGDAVWGTTKSSTTYEDYAFDISNAYFNDDDKKLTIIIYELAAAGGYVTSPEVIVDYNLENEMESDEPTEKVIGNKVLFSQDFEDASTIDEYWTTSVTDRYASEQPTLADESHYGKYHAGNTNSATLTYSALNNVGEEYTTTSDYSLDFDFAVTPINCNGSAQSQIFKIFDTDNSLLCSWTAAIPGDTPPTNTTGTFSLGNTETGTFIANVDPYWYHINISASSDGTVMTVTDIEGNTSEQYTLSDHLIYIGNLTYATGKIQGGLCLDDITLTANAWLDLTLSPTVAPYYAEGIYQTVTLDRNFNAGYSTLCLPFSMSVSQFTGGDTEAYVAYLSEVVESNGKTSILFTNTTEIEANTPCIIYLSKALDAPTFNNIAVHESAAKTITAGSWTMRGNFTPAFSMHGKYGVAYNAKIMKGGSSSTLNAYSAYLTGPANANAKLYFGGFENVEEEPTGIVITNGDKDALPNGKFADDQQIIILHNGKRYRVSGVMLR